MSCSPTYESEALKQEAFLLQSAFDLVFSDRAVGPAVFQMISQLDVEAREKGEPSGLQVRYAVDLAADGFTVMRLGDLRQPDETVTVPGNYVELYCRIRDGFPTDEWLGPVMVERPVTGDETEHSVDRDHD